MSEEVNKDDSVFSFCFVFRDLALTAFAWGFFSYENSIMCDLRASIKTIRITVSLMMCIQNL